VYQILILVWWISRIKINYPHMYVARPVLEHRLGLRSHWLGVRPMSKMTELASGAITATEMLALAGRTNSL
jgi:hypothetical protein